MTAAVGWDEVAVGTTIPARDFPLLRVDLLRFCGACCDYTATHWNERVARAVGLPDVIAHGTLIIAEAVRLVSDWAGDPGAVREYQGRFSRPVIVPDDDRGATLLASGVVENKLDDRCVVVRLSVQSEGHQVLAGARAIVQLA